MFKARSLNQTHTRVHSDLCMRVQLVQIKEIALATEEHLELVHSPEYVKWLAEQVQEGVPKVIADPEEPAEVTYITSTSYSDALKVRV